MDIEQDRFHVHVKELIVSQLVILVILHELVGHASCYLARLIRHSHEVRCAGLSDGITGRHSQPE